ncbi:MAG TPA: alpha/beta fold hydrolase [Acidimicrobiales bacterium]|nr:alpha/beta fold hydrolase [Acidimicrobiales bacterium]
MTHRGYLAGVGAAALAALWWRRGREVGDPCGPLGVALPGGSTTRLQTPDGAELAVLVAGPSEGPMVVLSHCWTGAMDIWAPVARRLVARGHRVVLYDQRGHGASSFGQGVDEIGVLGDDLALVLDHVGAHDVVVAGHSMGGMTVQAYLARHGADARARVRGIVLVSTAAKVTPRALPAFAAELLMGDRVVGLTRDPRIGRIATRRVVGRRAVPSHLDVVHRTLHATPARVRAACLLAMSRMDLRAAIAAAHVPATVLVGSRDRLTPPRLGRQLCRAWPGAVLQVLPGAGHMLPLEAPADVTDAIARAAAAAPAPSVEHPPAPQVTSHRAG